MIASLAWLLSLMMAPHSLALHGNLAGAWGHWLPLGVLLAAAVYLLNFIARSRIKSGAGFFAGQHAVYLASWGPVSALVIPLAGPLVAALAGATGLLVTAGFAFNETFLYWFPNFAFAYLLLGIVMLLHVAGDAWVRGFQQLFIATVLGGILLLVLIAIGQPAPALAPTEVKAAGFLKQTWPGFLLLFVGVDLFSLNHSAGRAARVKVQMMLLCGVGLAFLLFSLWGWTAVNFVASQRLVDTTIAPVIVARQVWGQYGRYTMGVVTIAGTLAAVNALFSMVAVTLHHHLGLVRDQKPDGASRVSNRWVVILLGAATAALMALGMAGTDEIDVALRAGLVLWMLHYALVPLLGLRSSPSADLPNRLLLGVGGGLMLAGALALIYQDSDRQFMLMFIFASLSALTLLVIGGHWLLKHRQPQQHERNLS